MPSPQSTEMVTEIPVLVNIHALGEGAELLMLAPPKKEVAPTKRPITAKDLIKKQEDSKKARK